MPPIILAPFPASGNHDRSPLLPGRRPLWTADDRPNQFIKGPGETRKAATLTGCGFCIERKARESNPPNRFSRAVCQPTRAAFRIPWTAGESNPDFLREAGVIPLDQQPESVIPDGIEPSFPACEAGVVAVGPRDREEPSDVYGGRTRTSAVTGPRAEPLHQYTGVVEGKSQRAAQPGCRESNPVCPVQSRAGFRYNTPQHPVRTTGVEPAFCSFRTSRPLHLVHVLNRDCRASSGNRTHASAMGGQQACHYIMDAKGSREARRPVPMAGVEPAAFSL